ncbi:HTH-type transcriptional regulator EthR [termite gut metagenome]|uniref:HTH-type transcriptional regulator EthR n=1 Tax=termite gut metagenome TaxID=433724 RepID=A0A5J4SZW5_9ZZZZ
MTEITDNHEHTIIETAKQLFVARGYEKTCMCDIAAAAGINRTTLHYYFRTKEKMFQAVFGSIVQTIVPKLKSIFDENIPLLAKMDKALDEYISIFIYNPYLPKFVIGEIQRDVNHLTDTARSLGFDTYLSEIMQDIYVGIEQENLNKPPIVLVFSTFYSQLIFPFLARNLIVALFYENDMEFAEKFMQEWKKNVINQMRMMLEK